MVIIVINISIRHGTTNLKVLIMLSLYLSSLRSVSKNFSINETKQISLRGTIHNFSMNCCVIDIKYILQCYKYLMKELNKIIEP